MTTITKYRFNLLALLQVFALVLTSSIVEAQKVRSDSSYFKIEGDKRDRITLPFELINNLVVIKASINGSNTLKFIVDTGVRYTLITSMYDEEIPIFSSRPINLAGLGEGEALPAYYSENNQISIKGITGVNMDVVFLGRDIFMLSTFMGTDVHGLIGYDLFANFAVEINYRKRVIYLYDPDEFESKFEKLPRHRKWFEYPIYIENRKPYLNVRYKNSPNDSYTPLRVLIDTGSSKAFALYESTHPEIKLPEATISTFLGTGLSGNVTGYLGRIQSMKLGDFDFEKPVVAFPDSISVRRALKINNRHGSIGGEAFRRFKVILHYKNRSIYLRKNRDFNEDFDYNASGIEVGTPLGSLPYYVISDVREGSPADRAGVEEGDVLQRINGQRVENFSLNDVMHYFHKKEGPRLSLEVQRNDTTTAEFELFMENELKVDAD